MKYVPYKEEVSVENIENFVNNLLGGGGDYKKMHEMINGNVF